LELEQGTVEVVGQGVHLLRALQHQMPCLGQFDLFAHSVE
jgi:hypothetical protein